MENTIVFKNFTKKFKNKTIGPFDFNIRKGNLTAVLGTSGSGKTVVINSILGIIKRFKGNIVVEGIERSKRDYFTVNDNIGYYSQMDFSLNNESAFSFLQDIALVMSIGKKDALERIEYWMNFFDLWKDKDKKIKNFSFGMKNRLNLILCFIKEPRLLVLDEPGANLDSYWRNKIKNLLIGYKNEGKTIIITSHNIDEISDIIDDYIVIEDGKCIFQGTKEELDIYSKYKVYITEKFNVEEFRQFLESKNIRSFKFDPLENSLVIAIQNYKQINFLFLYLIKESLPMKDLVRLPVNIESVKKAVDAIQPQQN